MSFGCVTPLDAGTIPEVVRDVTIHVVTDAGQRSGVRVRDLYEHHVIAVVLYDQAKLRLQPDESGYGLDAEVVVFSVQRHHPEVLVASLHLYYVVSAQSYSVPIDAGFHVRRVADCMIRLPVFVLDVDDKWRQSTGLTGV